MSMTITTLEMQATVQFKSNTQSVNVVSVNTGIYYQEINNIHDRTISFHLGPGQEFDAYLLFVATTGNVTDIQVNISTIVDGVGVGYVRVGFPQDLDSCHTPVRSGKSLEGFILPNTSCPIYIETNGNFYYHSLGMRPTPGRQHIVTIDTKCRSHHETYFMKFQYLPYGDDVLAVALKTDYVTETITNFQDTANISLWARTDDSQTRAWLDGIEIALFVVGLDASWTKTWTDVTIPVTHGNGQSEMLWTPSVLDVRGGTIVGMASVFDIATTPSDRIAHTPEIFTLSMMPSSDKTVDAFFDISGKLSSDCQRLELNSLMVKIGKKVTHLNLKILDCSFSGSVLLESTSLSEMTSLFLRWMGNETFVFDRLTFSVRLPSARTQNFQCDS